MGWGCACMPSNKHSALSHRTYIFIDPTKLWTIWPELIGTSAALAGTYFQHHPTGAYFRVADFDHGPAAIVALTWFVVANVAAHLACLVVLYERSPDKSVYSRAMTLRASTHEFAILGSVFLQVASGSLTMVVPNRLLLLL